VILRGRYSAVPQDTLPNVDDTIYLPPPLKRCGTAERQNDKWRRFERCPYSALRRTEAVGAVELGLLPELQRVRCIQIPDGQAN
jgi:hypothetical protein